jgi:hypothetical protein
LASNEPIQFKNCALCFFSLKKIACEWVGNHDFDHFWSKKSQNFLNFMEHIYAHWKDWTFIFKTPGEAWKNVPKFLNKVHFREGCFLIFPIQILPDILYGNF